MPQGYRGVPTDKVTERWSESDFFFVARCVDDLSDQNSGSSGGAVPVSRGRLAKGIHGAFDTLPIRGRTCTRCVV